MSCHDVYEETCDCVCCSGVSKCVSQKDVICCDNSFLTSHPLGCSSGHRSNCLKTSALWTHCGMWNNSGVNPELFMRLCSKLILHSGTQIVTFSAIEGKQSFFGLLETFLKRLFV